MATFFLDTLGGNDALDGTTFANRWKTFTLGATTARIAPGDIIRVMASPIKTSLGITGAWTNNATGLNATVAITSSTNATPIVITKATHGLTSADTVCVSGHTVNTKANGIWDIVVIDANTFSLTGSVGNGVGGATGTYRKINNCRITLASALIANVAVFGNQGYKTNWTASVNVTNTVINTDYKEGGECQQIDIAAAFTTGLAAYFPTGTLNLSGYQQLSFWVKQTAGTIGAAGSWTLSLCSDALGVTAVDTFNGPLLGSLNNWSPITVDKGSALGTSIQSIALNIITDNGAQTFLLDNIIAVKAPASADSLSLTSLIGKNTTGETFSGIQSINGTRVMLDRNVNCIPTLTTIQAGYTGVTETVTTWKQETTKWPMSSGATTLQAVQDSGTEALGVITFSGGWDTTAMTTQTGETWLDVQNGTGNFFNDQSNFVTFDKINIVRANIGFVGTFAYKRTFISHVNNCSGSSFSLSQGGANTLNVTANYGNSDAIGLSQTDTTTSLQLIANGNSGHGIVLNSRNCIAQSISANNNGAFGVMLSGGENFTLTNVTTSGNRAGNGIGAGGANYGGVHQNAYFYNALISEASPFYNGGNQGIYEGIRYTSENHGGVGNYTLINCGISGKIETENTVIKSTGQSWKISVQSALVTTTTPLYFPVARKAVNANLLVTVKAWMQRDNTGITHRLVCKGGQLAGVASDVTSSMTAVAGTWEELTITFTPTVAGVIEITTESFGGTTFAAYVDDMTFTQA